MDEKLYEALQSGALESLTWQRGLLAFAATIAFLLAARLAGHVVRRSLARGGHDGGAAFALGKLLTYFMSITGVRMGLGILGLPIGSLLLTSSALLVGVGFGVQHIARDFVSGVALLVEQSIRKDDFVTFGETRGTVRRIGFRSTQLLTRDGTALIVPNHRLTSSDVFNHTSPRRRTRLDVGFPVGFREDVNLVKEAVLAVAELQPEVQAEPAPMVRLDAILETHFQLVLLAWVEDPVMIPRVASELRFAIVRAFAERAIRFPTPELELQMRSDDNAA